MVSQLTALEFDGLRAVLGCPEFALEATRAQQRALAELVQGALQRPVQVHIQGLAGSGAGAGSGGMGGVDPAAPAAARTGGSGPMNRFAGGGGGEAPSAAALRSHPLVQKAIDLFSARVVEVREGSDDDARRPGASTP